MYMYQLYINVVLSHVGGNKESIYLYQYHVCVLPFINVFTYTWW